MMITVGIALALISSVLAFFAFARYFTRRELASTASRLDAARQALSDDHHAEALSLAGEAFWTDPNGVYSGEDATRARDVLVVVQTILDNYSKETARQFEPLIREFEAIQERGGSVPTNVLLPVESFLDDVAGDTFLAGEILENLKSGELELDLAKQRP